MLPPHWNWGTMSGRHSNCTWCMRGVGVLMRKRMLVSPNHAGQLAGPSLCASKTQMHFAPLLLAPCADVQQLC